MTKNGEYLDVADVVALLADHPAQGLARGNVGTVVEALDAEHVLVEFSDNAGAAYAITALPAADLLVLRYTRRAA